MKTLEEKQKIVQALATNLTLRATSLVLETRCDPGEVIAALLIVAASGATATGISREAFVTSADEIFEACAEERQQRSIPVAESTLKPRHLKSVN